ncbi:MAG: hypothetical protein ACREJM_05775 [Candidatus Saccharimonadales bacterium]
MTRKKAMRRLTSSLCLGLLGVLASAPAAIASHHHGQSPQVGWSLPRAASAGQAISFTWTGSNLGEGHKLVVQKPVGTAHTWRTILQLPTRSGSGQLSGLPLGKYRFRIADLVLVPRPRHGGHHRAYFRVMAQEVAGVAVFGEVPFSTLFNSPEHAHATSSYSFAYVASWQDWGTAPTAFTVEHNHCSFVHIAFLGVGWWLKGETEVPTATATVVQESREPTSVTDAENTIGSLDAALVPGQSWALNLSAHSNEPAFYINGYAVCDSTEPFS